MSAAIDDAKLEALANKAMGDVAGAMGLLMAYLGDQAGLYASLEAHGPIRSDALAERAGLEPKYVREWLSSNAALGYVSYDEGEETFALSPEQALIFAREGHPACMQGFFMSVLAQMETHARAVETFRSGQGRPWSYHSQCCFCGTDRFFRPGYEANLLASWIPSLDGVEASLRKGARVADVGCGQGSSTVLMAKAFPGSRFHGFDFHEPSIEKARARAREAGVENVEFQVATAKSYEEADFDLVCIFDALHDMGDPVGAARHVRETLKSDGTFMVVDHQPVVEIQPGLEIQITDPPRSFVDAVIRPVVVVECLERNLDVEQFPCQALQQQSGDEAIQVTLMSDDHFRLRQTSHM